MPTTSFLLPASAISLTESGSSGVWLDETNILAEDITYARNEIPADDGSYTPSAEEIAAGRPLPTKLHVKNFGFGLPATARVNGITVKTYVYDDYNNSDTNFNTGLQLYSSSSSTYNAANKIGIVKRVSTTYFYDTDPPENYVVETTLGGATDLWQPAQLDFNGVLFTARDAYLPGNDITITVREYGDVADPGTTFIENSGTDITIIPRCQNETAAFGQVDIFNYSALTSVEVAGVVFVAQAGAVTPGDATFQAATSNSATATSLSSQINAHPTTGPLVLAGSGGGTSVNMESYILGSGTNYTLDYTGAGANLFPTSGFFDPGLDVDPYVIEADYLDILFGWVATGSDAPLICTVEASGSGFGSPLSPGTGTLSGGVTSMLASVVNSADFGLIIYYPEPFYSAAYSNPLTFRFDYVKISIDYTELLPRLPLLGVG